MSFDAGVETCSTPPPHKDNLEVAISYLLRVRGVILAGLDGDRCTTNDNRNNTNDNRNTTSDTRCTHNGSNQNANSDTKTAELPVGRKCTWVSQSKCEGVSEDGQIGDGLHISGDDKIGKASINRCAESNENHLKSSNEMGDSFVETISDENTVGGFRTLLSNSEIDEETELQGLKVSGEFTDNDNDRTMFT